MEWKKAVFGQFIQWLRKVLAGSGRGRAADAAPEPSAPAIQIQSRQYICLHEAGHIETALLSGAQVTKVSLAVGSKDPHTSITHKPDLSTKVPIACGGYSVERILFDAGRVADENGTPMERATFQAQAMHNARRDKYPFYIKHPADSRGHYPGSPFQPGPNDTWSEASDAPFVAHAEKNIIPMLKDRLAVIEALAEALDRFGVMTSADIEGVRSRFPIP
jgi:hypothetical protein